MKVLVVYAHPNPDSFNNAILRTLQEALTDAGHEVRINDLYEEGFDPVLDRARLAQMSKGEMPADVLREQQQLRWAEGVIFIYPLWWCDRPAILKGWFDRVMTNGFAFEYTAEGAKGLLTQTKAMVLVTAGGDPASYQGLGADQFVVGPTVYGTLSFCGIKDILYKVFYGIPLATDEQRQEMLQEVRKLGESF